MKSTGILDESGRIGESDKPILLGARLILEDEDDTLEIYDCEFVPGFEKVILYLDKDVPYIMFDNRVYRSNKGLYAHLPEGGKFIVYYGV